MQKLRVALACVLLPTLSHAGTVTPELTLWQEDKRLPEMHVSLGARASNSHYIKAPAQIIDLESVLAREMLPKAGFLLSENDPVQPRQKTANVGFVTWEKPYETIYIAARSYPSQTMSAPAAPMRKVPAPAPIALLFTAMTFSVLLKRNHYRRKDSKVTRENLDERRKRSRYPDRDAFRFSSSFSRKPIVVSQP